MRSHRTGTVPTNRGGAPGLELARGRASVVYDMGDGTVLRRCLDPAADMAGEAALMAHARHHGVPTPHVLAASGPDLVMERVIGPTMLGDLVAHPDRAAQHGRTLAELHHWLDCVPPPDRAPAEHRLLHLDLHPGNVLLSASGPVLVDWTNATWGARPLDVATTWVVLACMGPTAGEAAPHLERVRTALLEVFLDHVDQSAARSALPEATAARLADPATSVTEREVIARLVGR